MKLKLNILQNEEFEFSIEDVKKITKQNYIKKQSYFIEDVLYNISDNPILSYGDNVEYFQTPDRQPKDKDIYIDFIVNATENDVEKYHENTGRVTITDRLVNSKNEFVTLLQQGNEEKNIMPLNDEELLAFAIAHEVGHAIHGQMILDHDSAFGISTVPLNYSDKEITQAFFLDNVSKLNFSERKDNLGNELLKWQTEGFADLYASQVMKELYPDNYKDILQSVSFARRNEPSNYQSSPLIDDFMKNDPQFNNNNDFLNYFKNEMISHNTSQLNNYLNNKLIDEHWNFPNKIEDIITFVGYVSSFDETCIKSDLHSKIKSAEQVLKEKHININLTHLDFLEKRIPKELLKNLDKGFLLNKKEANIDESKTPKNKLTSNSLFNKFLHVTNHEEKNKKNSMTSFKEELLNNQPKKEIQNIKKSIKPKLGL